VLASFTRKILQALATCDAAIQCTCNLHKTLTSTIAKLIGSAAITKVGWIDPSLATETAGIVQTTC
jgi:hypothetical protein